MDMSELERLEFQVGTLKLSEAIRIGARMRPNCRISWGDGVGSCALMAACEATGMSYQNERSGEKIRAHLDKAIPGWREADNAYSLHQDSIPDHKGLTISNYHYLGHSREAIADWLESQGH